MLTLEQVTLLFDEFLEGMPEITVTCTPELWATIYECYSGYKRSYLVHSWAKFLLQHPLTQDEDGNG